MTPVAAIEIRTLRVVLGDQPALRAIDLSVTAGTRLALVGPKWGDGRRLDNPDDFVRLELQTAKSLNVRVYPLLIGETKAPARDQLPQELQPF